MKKLMTSLLAVLLCGIGFLWADGAKVTGTVQCVWEGSPNSSGLTGTVTLWKDGAATAHSGSINSGTYEITDVPAGTYTAKFEGDMKGSACAGDNTVTVAEGAANNGAEVSCNIMATISSTPDPGPTTVTMWVKVGYNSVNSGGYSNFNGLAGATITCKQGSNTIETKTTSSSGYNSAAGAYLDAGVVSFSVTAGETYSFSVTASGYKDKTVTDVTGVSNSSSQAYQIAMEEVLATVSGTLKWGGETVTAFPEGMGLVFRSNNTNYTAEMGENGYTVNCKPGTATLYVTDANAAIDYSLNSLKVSKNYAVTVPENGTLTITDNAETLTQNIEINKTAASAIVMTNPDDEIGNYDLTVTSTDNTTIRPTPNNGTFTFSGLKPGTYTLVLDHFGLKIKEGKATVTIAETLEDVTVTLETEAAPGTVKFEGKITYRDKTLEWDEQPKGLTGASVSLYHAKKDVATESFIPDGDAVGTATVAEDGTWSMSPEIVGGYYIASVTRDDILTTYSYYRSVTSNRDVELSFNSLKMIWVSGEVTNPADISNTELTWTWAGENTLPDNYNPTCSVEYDQTTGKYYAYVLGVNPIAGTCTLNLKGSNGEGALMAASEEVTIASDRKPVTQNLTAVKDENSGYMTVHYKYRTTEGKDVPVANHYVKISLDNGSEDGQYLAYPQTDANGDIKYLVDKDKAYILATENSTSTGYAASKATVNGFATFNGNLQPNDTTIFLTALPIPAWIKLTGSVTLPEGVTKLSDLGEDLRIAVQTLRDLEIMTAPIKSDGTYTIDSIPVPAKDLSVTAPLFLAQTGGKTNAYGAEVPYNYGISNITTYYLYTTVDYETKTANVTIAKIACNVSGTVSPAREGQVTLTKQGDEEPAYTTNVISGKYTFQGVTAGTYTLKTNCTGYEPATAEVTVEATLADVTVPAITLNDAPLDVTAHGSLTATNPANETTYYFAGAKLAIWNSDKTQALVETTVTEDNNGWFSMTFRSVKGAKVFFTMEHPSIEPISKEYTVNGADLEISASDLGYKFIDNTPNEKVVMTDFDAKWNATFDSLKLSWKWPASADGKIQTITLNRKLSTESGNGVTLKTWEKTGENPHETYAFATAELPVGYTDTVKQSLSYTYMFTIIYADASHSRKDVSFVADMRDGKRYELAYTVNDDKMGTLTSYGQPEGKYLEGDQITLTAKAKEGYKFVEFLKNDEKLSEAEIATLKLYSDTMAIYGFKMPAYDLTVKAVFVSRSGEGPNDPETKEYTVTLVSNNEAWGTVSGAGTFEEGKEIEVKATVTDEAKYKFVAWKEGDKELSKDATYKFKVEKDITLTAVFEEKVANENLKAARWAIFAEDGAIVIKGINGDRYDIYDLNGHHCGAALCTGAEIRLNVAKSKLYIVRRLGADGSFDAKKIVVR